MRVSTKQSGFSGIEVVIVVAILIIVGLLGYTFYANYQDKSAKSTESSEMDTAESTAEITTTEGLDEASAMIDQTDVEASNSDDLSELDKEMSDL